MNETDPHPTDLDATDLTHRPIGRRPLIQAALAPLAAAVLLAGCATATPAATPAAAGVAAKIAVPASVPTKNLAGLTLNVGDQKAGLEALLKAAGELQDVPYTIKWSTFTSGPPLLEAVNAGAVDVGGVGNTPPIFSAAAGGKIAIISASRDSAAGDAVLVPKGSTVKTFADLKGKRVAVAKGSSAHGNLLLQLTKVGLVPADVQTTFIAPSDGYAALAAGRVDAWVVWDPYTAQAEQQLGARVLTSGRGLTNGLGFQVASRAALADGRRNSAIADLVGRTVRAHIWSKAHPQQWARVYAQQSGLPYSVTLASALRSDDDPIKLTPQLAASEQKLADAFADAKVIPTRPTIANIIDTRYNHAATDQGATT
jgi:sulfonate transport system substrate-binding protein